ncbi:hypothetical protein [Streptomyces sp. NPDC001889]
MPPDTTLLTYTASAPQGLPTGDPQAGLDIAVTANTAGPVYCGQIHVAVPVGPGAASVFTAPPIASVTTNTWVPTSAPRRSSDPYSTPDTTADYTATIVYDALTGTAQPIGIGLTLGLEGAVNSTFGDTEIRIRETSGTTPDPATFTTKETKVMVRKTPADFYIRNFIATKPASPTVPCSDFTKGTDIRLQWESNGTNFKITTPTQTIDLGTRTEYTLTGGAGRDITLLLIATSTPATGSQAVLYETLTLTISNPDLTPTSVDIAGTLNVTGDATLATATAAALTATNLTASDAAIKVKLDAEELDTKKLTAASAALTDLTANGLTQVLGRVSLFGRRELIYRGTDSNGESSVTRNTDGFILMESKGEWNHRADGGMTVTVNIDGEQFDLGPSEYLETAIIPVPAGTRWTYNVSTTSFDFNVEPTIYWCPLGKTQT